MAAEKATIPVVDLTGEDAVVIKELHEAFCSIGFVFITNHGIAEEQVRDVFETAQSFFSLPNGEKLCCSRDASTKNSGYNAVGNEKLDPSNPGDLKESFNVACAAEELSQDNKVWPDTSLPHFRPTILRFYSSCQKLALKLLHYMGKALQLEDPSFFVKEHEQIGKADKNLTTLRLLHYPPIKSQASIKPNQLRCGEHVDYGSITLLFQQPIGGLQVKTLEGHYVDVPYVDRAILLNLGALMQKWTGDVYRATPHRVLIPHDDIIRQRSRLSTAFFVHPDHDCVVKTIDGSEKYPPIRAEDDTKNRFLKSFGYT